MRIHTKPEYFSSNSGDHDRSAVALLIISTNTTPKEN